MRVTVERLPSKRGWVAYPVTRGRPLNVKNRAASKRPVFEAPTRAEAIALAREGIKS